MIAYIIVDATANTPLHTLVKVSPLEILTTVDATDSESKEL